MYTPNKTDASRREGNVFKSRFIELWESSQVSSDTKFLVAFVRDDHWQLTIWVILWAEGSGLCRCTGKRRAVVSGRGNHESQAQPPDVGHAIEGHVQAQAVPR